MKTRVLLRCLLSALAVAADAAFDSLALRRSVFKVESIGDVYVAVTGLPNPQRDHAMRMAKFARDCIQKVGVLTAQLAPTLGNETLSLGLRVGLHSGDVSGLAFAAWHLVMLIAH